MAEQDVSDRLAQIDAREKNATVRPWWQGPHYRNDVHSISGRIAEIGEINTHPAIDNAAFIAGARQDIPWMRNHITKQDAVNTRLSDALAQVKAENERLKAKLNAERLVVIETIARKERAMWNESNMRVENERLSAVIQELQGENDHLAVLVEGYQNT